MHTACLDCDLLIDLPRLEEGQRAKCPRCGYILAAQPRDGFRRALAYALAGLVFLALANGFPFLSFEQSGLANVMTLPQTAMSLYAGGFTGLAVLVGGFIVLVPAVMMIMLVAMLVPVVNGRHARYLKPFARWLYRMGPWSMVEVYLIGVIVSLVKIMALATVHLGFSFWAYAAFTLCFIATISVLDRVALWDRIEELSA
jgi:paraquat-inducible protein A